MAGLVDAELEVAQGLSSAGSSAEIDVEGSTVPDAHAHVGVAAVAVKRCVDALVVQAGRQGVAWWWCLEVVDGGIAV